MNYLKSVILKTNELFFPLKRSVKKYEFNNIQNYKSYLESFEQNQWDLFEQKFYEAFNSGCFSEDFKIDVIDISKDFEAAERGELPRVSRINGLTLKSISVTNNFGDTFAEGVKKVKYEKNNFFESSVFIIEPTVIQYMQTPSGGLIIYVCPQKVVDLFHNQPEVIIYQKFNRITEVKTSDITQSLKFFLLCCEEKSIWGKSSLLGKFKYAWIVNYRSKLLNMFLSQLEQVLLSQKRA